MEFLRVFDHWAFCETQPALSLRAAAVVLKTRREGDEKFGNRDTKRKGYVSIQHELLT